MMNTTYILIDAVKKIIDEIDSQQIQEWERKERSYCLQMEGKIIYTTKDSNSMLVCAVQNMLETPRANFFITTVM